MRAWFQGCQGLLDHQTVSIPHKAASKCYAALRARVSARAGGFSQHLRREHSGSGKSILEVWFSPALALPDPCFPQKSCF